MEIIFLVVYALLINWVCSLNNSIREEKDKNTRYILILLSIIIGLLSGVTLSLL